MIVICEFVETTHREASSNTHSTTHSVEKVPKGRNFNTRDKTSTSQNVIKLNISTDANRDFVVRKEIWARDTATQVKN